MEKKQKERKKMKNRIKVMLTEFGGIQVVSIPLKLYKDSYNTTSIECLVPKRNNEKSILKMYASGRDSLGQKVWTSQTYNLVYEKDIIYNQTEYEIYTAMLPKEFCKENGQIEITFTHYSLTEEERVEELLTSGTINLYIDGIGNNNAGVAISPYDITASKVNKLVKEMKEVQDWTAKDIPISKAERLPYDTVQDMLNGLNANKVDKVQVEAGKLLLSNGIGGIEASDVGIQEYEDQKGYIDEKHAEQEQRMDRMQEEITANTEERHIHTNKEILDSYTVQNSELLANVQARHEHANKEILDDVTEAFTTALKGNVEGSITSVGLDSNTGIFTFTKNNGEEIRVDTLLEKVIVNFRFDKERQALILISEDGTEQEVELGALLRLYQGTDGAEITVTVDRNNNIGASIKAGAVTEGKIGDYAVTEIKLHQTIVDKLNSIVPAREIVEFIYPVGILLEFGEEFDPNVKWNFTEWKRIENCFSYASGDKQVGDRGGEEEHRLTVEELAEHGHTQDEHNHGVTADRKYGGNGSGDWNWCGWDNGDRGGRQNQTLYSDSRRPAIHSTGGNKPHNNMPPYLVVAKWQRIR